jgi:hypothetical protein
MAAAIQAYSLVVSSFHATLSDATKQSYASVHAVFTKIPLGFPANTVGLQLPVTLSMHDTVDLKVRSFEYLSGLTY